MEAKDLIPGLLDDVAMQCLAQVPPRRLATLRGVCKGWESLVRSDGEFYEARRRAGKLRPAICLVQALPQPSEALDGQPPPKQRSGAALRYGISLLDMATRSWERLPPLPDSPSGLPLFCRCVSVDGKLFVVGGWDPATYAASRRVYCFDFARGGWQRRAEMLSDRSFFACVAAGGYIYVAGGHDGNKRALKTVERYDPVSNRWDRLADMSEERDECAAVVSPISGELVVLSGYSTEAQGEFQASAEALDTKTGQWRRIDGFWPVGRCPSAVGAVAEDDGKEAFVSIGDDGEARRRGGAGDWKPLVSGPPSAKVSCCSVRSSVLVAAQRDGECKLMGLGSKPRGASGWSEIAVGGAEFSGPVQCICLVEI